jgi:RimJ/RimL family protein N-acetyltransferase
MILVRPIHGFDTDGIEELLNRNADDLNWSHVDATWRARKIAEHAGLGVKAIRVGEFSDINGQIVGVAILTRGPHDSTKHAAHLRLLVDKAHRGQGLGTELVQKAVAYAQMFDIERVEAQPYTKADYVDFWSRCGFRYEGRRRNAARDIGTGKLVSTDVWAWTS